MVGAVERRRRARDTHGGERVPVSVGRSQWLERNYPPSDSDVSSRRGVGGRRGRGWRGVVFTRQGCWWCCAVVAASARALVPFLVYCCPIERADEPVSKHARRHPRMVRSLLTFFRSLVKRPRSRPAPWHVLLLLCVSSRPISTNHPGDIDDDRSEGAVVLHVCSSRVSIGSVYCSWKHRERGVRGCWEEWVVLRNAACNL